MRTETARDEILQTLSLCRKAGKLVHGFDAVRSAIGAGKTELVLTAADISEKTGKEIRHFCGQEGGVPLRDLPVTINEIWFAVSKKAGVLAVTDRGLAQKLAGILDRIHKGEDAGC